MVVGGKQCYFTQTNPATDLSQAATHYRTDGRMQYVTDHLFRSWFQSTGGYATRVRVMLCMSWIFFVAEGGLMRPGSLSVRLYVFVMICSSKIWLFHLVHNCIKDLGIESE